MSALLELASRVEALEGPSREVDARIHWREDGPFPDDFSISGVGQDVSAEWDDRRKARGGYVPRYTASLDAAMSLIPPEMCLHSLGESRYMVRGPWLAHLVRRDKDAPYDGISASASTAAAAVVAAALRSRAGASV